MLNAKNSLALAAITALAIAACGPKPEPLTPTPAAPDAGAPEPKAETPRLPEKAPDSPTTGAVRISDEIKEECGIAGPDAYFAFDSANVRPEDARTLALVVKCFTTGALAGRTLSLVGHADPRGTSDYNMTLGQSRADAVGTYLVGHGMAKAKTTSTTRGAMDAAGSDEPTWAKDRRVDILVAQ